MPSAGRISTTVALIVFKESQLDNALANVAVVAKAKIIGNHDVRPTSLITLVVELAATYKVSEPACGGIGSTEKLFSVAKD